MEARELRIGNWVQHAGVPYQATIHTIIVCQDTSGALSKPEPITIDYEWLERLGFEYCESNESWQLDTDLGFSIWGREGKGFEVYVESNPCGESFNYVHQIQNAFYSLMQKELTIKTN